MFTTTSTRVETNGAAVDALRANSDSVAIRDFFRAYDLRVIAFESLSELAVHEGQLLALNNNLTWGQW